MEKKEKRGQKGKWGKDGDKGKPGERKDTVLTKQWGKCFNLGRTYTPALVTARLCLCVFGQIV